MTYLVWEKQLLRYLKSQSAEDKKQAVDYYREMYYDKVERGENPDDVLLGFGDPRNCAAKILMEHVSDDNRTTSTPKEKYTVPKSEHKKTYGYTVPKRATVGSVVGWFFITVLLLIPLGAAAISVVAVFAAVAVSGYAMILAGIIYAIVSPFGMIFGWGGALALAGIGTGIVTAGVGAILSVTFTLLTKYSAIGLCKALKIIVKGRA